MFVLIALYVKSIVVVSSNKVLLLFAGNFISTFGCLFSSPSSISSSQFPSTPHDGQHMHILYWLFLL